jgi:hypothetical protein
MLGAYKAGNLNQNDILDKVVCRKCGKLFYFWFKTKLTNVELDFHLKKNRLKSIPRTSLSISQRHSK